MKLVLCAHAGGGGRLTRRRSLARMARCTKGVTAIEFALVAPMLILLIIAIIEIGMVLTAQSVLDSATFAGARTAKTGFVAGSATQHQTIVAAIRRDVSSFLDPDQVTLTSLSYSDYANVGKPEPFTDTNRNGVRDPSESYTDVNKNARYDLDQGATGYGVAGSIVVFTSSYNWRLFTPLVGNVLGTDGTIALRSRAVVKNEPY